MTHSHHDAPHEAQRKLAQGLLVRLETLLETQRRLSVSDWRPAEADLLHRSLHDLAESACQLGMKAVLDAAHQAEARLGAILTTGSATDANEWVSLGLELRRMVRLARAQLGANRGGRPFRVMLVDHDPLTLEIQAGVLQAAGMIVHASSKPLQALEVIDEFLPDVLMLDTSMADISGDELAAIVREREPFADLPVLYLAAETDLSSGLPAPSLVDGDGLLIKPVRADDLVSAVAARAQQARLNATGRQRAPSTLCERAHEQLAVALHTVMSVADADGIIVDVNERFCEVSGYSRDELVGRTHNVVKSCRHSYLFYRDMWDRIASGRIWQGELCDRRKDGSLYWLSSTITPFAGTDGAPLEYVFTGTDVTELKAVMAERCKRDDMQRAAFEAAADLAAAAGSKTDAALDCVLDCSGKAYGADLAFLLLVSVDCTRTSRADESRAPQRVSAKDTIHHLPAERLRWLLSQAATKTVVTVADVGALPVAADSERTLFRQLEVRSLRSFPLTGRSGTIGFLCLACSDALPDWTGLETDFVRLIAAAICTTLERKGAEQEAQRQAEQLRRWGNAANIGTWAWDVGTGVLQWDERAAVMCGHASGEPDTSYEGFLDAVHPADRKEVVDAMSAGLERNDPYEIEYRTVLADGTVHWLLQRGVVVRDAEGGTLAMVGVVQDISERKRVTLALDESARRLRETEQRFAFAVEGAGDGVWDWDVTTGSMVLSGNYEGMLGYTDGELDRTIDTWAAMVHPGDVASVRKTLDAYLADEIPTYGVELRLRRKGGDYTWILCRGKVTERNAEGRPLRMVGIHTDISRRKSEEAELIAARETADRANRAKSEFLSSMSHELRTPLTAVIGFAQLMQHDRALAEEHRDSVNEILTAGRHLLDLIDEVLDLAKVESGTLDLSLEPVRLRGVVEECLALIRSLAENLGIEVEYRVEGETAVRADRKRLKQALVNLLSNAVKYNRRGGSVILDVQQPGPNHLRIRVKDNGIGIPEERFGDLFQPFSRLAAERRGTAGAGIGLAFTRRMVDMMGGTVGFESEVGRGSTFWVELPCAPAPSCDDAPPPGTASVSDGETPKKTVQNPWTSSCPDDR